MTRRLHRCLTCTPQAPTPETPFTRKRGYTRHADRVCSHCRRRGVSVVDGTLRLPLELRFLPRLADPDAPTVAELDAGVDFTGMFR